VTRLEQYPSGCDVQSFGRLTILSEQKSAPASERPQSG
jgi:hypothetical protein